MIQNLQKLIVTTVMLLLSTSFYAQSCANYAPVTRQTGIPYSSIAASNPSYFIWRNTSSNQNDDNRSYQVPIGFDFWYLGVRYTDFSVSLNGVIDFSTSTSDGNTPSGSSNYGSHWSNQFSTAAKTMLALAPLYGDLWTGNGGTSPIATSIFYNVTGTAPNRVLTVEWLNFDHWNSPVNSPNANYNFQVKLYETTGVIEFVYGTMTAVGGGSYPLQYACGINNDWATGGTNATRLLTQQTANTTTFSSAAKNNLTTVPTSNTKLTFAPKTPTGTPPAALSFSFITSSGMTVNWTNWCTNEAGYVLYNSTDNVTFNFVAQTAANATSYASTGLLPSTLYYWKVYAVTDGKLSSAVLGNQSTSAAGNKISVSSGRWDQNNRWSPSGVPTAGDNVTIADGHTIEGRDNIPMECNNLTVGQGSSGVLLIGRNNNNSTQTLIVHNNVIINAGAQMIANTTSTTTHDVTVSGNITNNGTLNFAPDVNSFADITFNKNGNQSISGTGGTLRFNNINVNMGTVSSNTLDITASNFTVASSNFLTLTNGTFKLSSAANITPFTGNVALPLSTGLWVNNASAIINTTGGTLTLYGVIRVNSGTLNIGNATNNNLTSIGGKVYFNGGNINIAGRLDKAGTPVISFYNMTGGTLTLNTVGSTTAGAAPFRMDEVGSTFNMSGGTIIIRRSGAGNLGYLNTGSTGSVTGGVLQIGDASTPAGQTMQINSTKEIGGLVVNNGATALLNTNPLIIANGVTVNSGVLNANNLNITLGGNWLNAGTFTPGTATVNFNGVNQSITKTTGETFNHLTLSGSGTKTLGGAITTNGNLTIGSGVTLDVTTNNYGVNVKRNWTNNGTFLAQNGTVTFNGSAAQTIGGSAVTNFRNIALNNSTGASLSQAQNLLGTLTLTLGTFNTNSQVFTLISDISGTARIATIPAGADITGNITMQRYIGAGATNWRFLTTATNGTTIADWKDDFIMSGFIGSQYPDWPTAANPWPSIYFYNESKPGIQDSGYVAATNITNTISPGQGLWVWSGDTITGTQAFTVDVTGPPNKGNINLPVTFTSSAGAANDGWNMVGNPYPSTIDWNSANWTKTRINNAIYIWNPQNQQFSSYVSGIGTNGGSRYIASSQAFWVQSNAASPVLTVRETCKSAVDQAFIRDAIANQQLLTFGVQKGSKHDESVLRFIEGSTDSFDADFDAYKLASADVDMPYIALINNNDELSVNSYELGTSLTIPVKVLASTNGLITMTFDKNNLTDLSCAILEDLQTGTKTNVITSSSYTFYHTSATDSARFLLHIWNNKTKEVINPTCFESTNAQIIAHTSGNGPWNFSLSNNNGTISTFNTTIDSNAITSLGADTYYLQITDQSSTCGSTIDTVVITNPPLLSTSYTVTNPSSALVNDGAIDYTVSGGVAPYTYYWSTTDTTEDLSNINSGTYTVTVTDANGCSLNETIVLDMSTGVNTVLNDEVFLIYPNPAKDWITIESKNLNNTIFTITTINGQLLMLETLNSTKSSFNISSLSSGIYFYEIRNENESAFKGKLLVVNK